MGCGTHSKEVSDVDVLGHLLEHAATYETTLMAQALYVGHTMKSHPDEFTGPRAAVQYELVQAWRREVLGVAHAEMRYLHITQLLLRAIGHACHAEPAARGAEARFIMEDWFAHHSGIPADLRQHILEIAASAKGDDERPRNVPVDLAKASLRALEELFGLAASRWAAAGQPSGDDPHHGEMQELFEAVRRWEREFVVEATVYHGDEAAKEQLRQRVAALFETDGAIAVGNTAEELREAGVPRAEARLRPMHELYRAVRELFTRLAARGYPLQSNADLQHELNHREGARAGLGHFHTSNGAMARPALCLGRPADQRAERNCRARATQSVEHVHELLDELLGASAGDTPFAAAAREFLAADADAAAYARSYVYAAQSEQMNALSAGKGGGAPREPLPFFPREPLALPVDQAEPLRRSNAYVLAHVTAAYKHELRLDPGFSAARAAPNVPGRDAEWWRALGAELPRRANAAFLLASLWLDRVYDRREFAHNMHSRWACEALVGPAFDVVLGPLLTVAGFFGSDVAMRLFCTDSAADLPDSEACRKLHALYVAHFKNRKPFSDYLTSANLDKLAVVVLEDLAAWADAQREHVAASGLSGLVREQLSSCFESVGVANEMALQFAYRIGGGTAESLPCHPRRLEANVAADAAAAAAAQRRDVRRDSQRDEEQDGPSHDDVDRRTKTQQHDGKHSVPATAPSDARRYEEDATTDGDGATRVLYRNTALLRLRYAGWLRCAAPSGADPCRDLTGCTGATRLHHADAAAAAGGAGVARLQRTVFDAPPQAPDADGATSAASKGGAPLVRGPGTPGDGVLPDWGLEVVEATLHVGHAMAAKDDPELTVAGGHKLLSMDHKAIRQHCPMAVRIARPDAAGPLHFCGENSVIGRYGEPLGPFGLQFVPRDDEAAGDGAGSAAHPRAFGRGAFGPEIEAMLPAERVGSGRFSRGPARPALAPTSRNGLPTWAIGASDRERRSVTPYGAYLGRVLPAGAGFGQRTAAQLTHGLLVDRAAQLLAAAAAVPATQPGTREFSEFVALVERARAVTLRPADTWQRLALARLYGHTLSGPETRGAAPPPVFEAVASQVGTRCLTVRSQEEEADQEHDHRGKHHTSKHERSQASREEARIQRSRRQSNARWTVSHVIGLDDADAGAMYTAGTVWIPVMLTGPQGGKVAVARTLMTARAEPDVVAAFVSFRRPLHAAGFTFSRDFAERELATTNPLQPQDTQLLREVVQVEETDGASDADARRLVVRGAGVRGLSDQGYALEFTATRCGDDAGEAAGDLPGAYAFTLSVEAVTLNEDGAVALSILFAKWCENATAVLRSVVDRELTSSSVVAAQPSVKAGVTTSDAMPEGAARTTRPPALTVNDKGHVGSDSDHARGSPNSASSSDSVRGTRAAVIKGADTVASPHSAKA